MTKKKYVLNPSPVPTEKQILFTWDSEGNAHIGHDDNLTLNDARMALGALGCIVADNEQREGGMEAVLAFMQRFFEGIFVYMGAPEASRVGPLLTDEVITEKMKEGRELVAALVADRAEVICTGCGEVLPGRVDHDCDAAPDHQ